MQAGMFASACCPRAPPADELHPPCTPWLLPTLARHSTVLHCTAAQPVSLLLERAQDPSRVQPAATPCNAQNCKLALGARA